MVLPQNFLINTGLIIVSLNIAQRNQLRKIAIAGFVFCEKNEVMVADTLHICSFVTVAGGKIYLAADNRLYSLLPALLIKGDGSVHIAMVGDGKCLHPRLLGSRYQILYPRGTIQQAVLRMNMQMDKISR